MYGNLIAPFHGVELSWSMQSDSHVYFYTRLVQIHAVLVHVFNLTLVWSSLVRPWSSNSISSRKANLGWIGKSPNWLHLLLDPVLFTTYDICCLQRHIAPMPIRFNHNCWWGSHLRVRCSACWCMQRPPKYTRLKHVKSHSKQTQYAAQSTI